MVLTTGKMNCEIENFFDGAFKGNRCKCSRADYGRLKGELGGNEYAGNSKKFWEKLWIYLWRE